MMRSWDQPDNVSEFFCIPTGDRYTECHILREIEGCIQYLVSLKIIDFVIDT